eukprot:2784712-Rhodomonas_salina.1
MYPALQRTNGYCADFGHGRRIGGLAGDGDAGRYSTVAVFLETTSFREWKADLVGRSLRLQTWN